MEVRIIKNEDDYQDALHKLEKLMDKSPIPGSKDEDDLELLLLVIKDYEQRVIEPIASDPIEAIKFRMDQMNLSRKEMVPFFGSISRVSEVLSRKRNLSLSMIRKLHKGLEIPLDSLMIKVRPRVKEPRTIRKHRIKPKRPLHGRKKRSFSS
ncbi:MAG TPA: transcriptional regulator [Chlamydiales bacterium]|nr:transcriptional regulator [Chlamydiales bacterium]